MSHPAARRAVQILTELPLKADVAHEQKEHQRRPVIAGHGAVPEGAKHVPGRRRTAHVGEKHERRGHKRVGHGHAHEKEEKHERDAPYAQRHRRHAGNAMVHEPPRGEQPGHGQGQEQRGHAAVFQYREHGGQHIVQQRQKQQRAAQRGEINERRERNAQYRGIQIAGVGIYQHGRDAVGDHDE